MLTVGVDLAAEPKGTAVAQIAWAVGRAQLTELLLGAIDQDIVRLARVSQKIGIDCALGWPAPFTEFLQNHSSQSHELTDDFGSSDWRRNLSYRTTDRVVRELTGRWPLSVATDRLGVTALRCAGLVARLAEAAVDVDRSGCGGLVEVYPAASLKIWGFDTAGYRESADIRSLLVAELERRANWLDLGGFNELMIQSCDAFDAVIASLATRAAAVGKSSAPTAEQLSIARIEGWIAIPMVQLEAIVE
jgi:predicted nuclease with RNAse H fold